MFFYNVIEKRKKNLIRWAKKLEVPDFPMETSELENVKKLSIRYKGIEKLPKEIGFLTNLEEIDASYNNLGDIPWEFAQLKKLKYVDFSHNQFADIPGVVCKHTQLDAINFEGNLIKKISPVVANLINLKYLNIAFNEIVELPSEIKFLACLEILDIAGNKLVDFPSTFHKLPSLKKIIIWENDFSGIPDQLSKMSTLTDIETEVNKERINHLFIEAVRADKLAEARKYFALGADINYQWQSYDNQQFSTPLFEARSIDMISFLLDNGADVNVTRAVKKSESFIFWDSEKIETETFLTKKHPPEITKYLKSIGLIS